MAKVFIYFIFFSRNNKGVTSWISGYPTIIPFLVQNSPKMVFFDDFDRVFGYPIIITLVFGYPIITRCLRLPRQFLDIH